MRPHRKARAIGCTATCVLVSVAAASGDGGAVLFADFSAARPPAILMVDGREGCSVAKYPAVCRIPVAVGAHTLEVVWPSEYDYINEGAQRSLPAQMNISEPREYRWCVYGPFGAGRDPCQKFSDGAVK